MILSILSQQTIHPAGYLRFIIYLLIYLDSGKVSCRVCIRDLIGEEATSLSPLPVFLHADIALSICVTSSLIFINGFSCELKVFNYLMKSEQEVVELLPILQGGQTMHICLCPLIHFFKKK